MTPIFRKEGIRVAELKRVVADWPETDAEGEPTEVWNQTGFGLSSPCVSVEILNKRTRDDGSPTADILLGTFREGDKHCGADPGTTDSMLAALVEQRGPAKLCFDDEDGWFLEFLHNRDMDDSWMSLDYSEDRSPTPTAAILAAVKAHNAEIIDVRQRRGTYSIYTPIPEPVVEQKCAFCSGTGYEHEDHGHYPCRAGCRMNIIKIVADAFKDACKINAPLTQISMPAKPLTGTGQQHKNGNQKSKTKIMGRFEYNEERGERRGNDRRHDNRGGGNRSNNRQQGHQHQHTDGFVTGGQALHAFGKFAAGITPGHPEWTEKDQAALDRATEIRSRA